MAACNTVIAKIDGSPNMHILRFRPRSQQTIQCCKHMHMQLMRLLKILAAKVLCLCRAPVQCRLAYHSHACSTQRRSTYTPRGAQPTHPEALNLHTWWVAE